MLREVYEYSGGEGGIRTHDTLARIPVFETGPFNHSGTSPTGLFYQTTYAWLELPPLCGDFVQPPHIRT